MISINNSKYSLNKCDALTKELLRIAMLY